MDQNDLDSFTMGLIQRTKERNKFLEQMNLTIESPIGSTIDSKNGFAGSPVSSKNVPTIGSPLKSKNVQNIGSPVDSKNVPTIGSPVGSRSVPTIGSPVGSRNVPTIGSPLKSKNVQNIGSPVGSKNTPTISSVFGLTVDSTHDSTICHKNDPKNGSTFVLKENLTMRSPIGSTIVSSNCATVYSKNTPTNCSKNASNNDSIIPSTNYSTTGSKSGLDTNTNTKKGPTIGSLHCSISHQKNDPKNNSKNEIIKGSKNDSKIGLRGVTEGTIDSTDPCLLPLSARRALFEKKMFQPNTKVNKIEEVINNFKETQKLPSNDNLSGSNVCEVKDLDYGNENRNFKESYSTDSNISSKADLSSDDENHNPKSQGFKSNLNYSTDSDEKDPSYNDKNFGLNEQNCPIQNHINESIGFNVSALLSNADENVSVIRQSTKIYPELPQSDELTDVHEPSEKDEHPLQNFISPIKGCDDQTMLVLPKKSVKTDPVKPKPLQPTTPLRTLSMYRREQNIRKTIVSSVEEDELITDLETEANKREWLKKYHEYKSKKMEKLKFEADKYNKIIYQSFRALDLCIQTNNVSQRIEAEKILLVNIIKKNACVDELYRLQKEETFDVPMDPVGKITFNKLTLLVKGNFFVSQASGIDLCEYHFICLFTCGDNVIATDALSSSHAIQEASLNFTNKIVFDHLRKDFRIRLVIYALALPKGKGHHDKKNIRLTPKTKSKIKYTHSPALKASPRNEKIKCNFKKMGHVDFTRDNIMKSRFSLENFMFDSPLEDQIMVDLAIGCEYNFKFNSYLNFHETSGEYPVWNRRWCVLNGPSICFWRYSEDEGDKQPMGVINLKHCVNPSINKASTDICMRPNSFSFITLEKQNNSFIPVKHLMAADVRKERDGWLENLNKALEMIRLWESDCLKPMEQASLDRLLK